LNITSAFSAGWPFKVMMPVTGTVSDFVQPKRVNNTASIM